MLALKCPPFSPRDVLFDGDLAIRRIFSQSSPFLRSIGQECLNDIVADIFQNPVDKRHFEPRLREQCQRRGLTVTKAFQKRLENLHYLLQIQARGRRNGAEASSPSA